MLCEIPPNNASLRHNNTSSCGPGMYLRRCCWFLGDVLLENLRIREVCRIFTARVPCTIYATIFRPLFDLFTNPKTMLIDADNALIDADNGD